jgi:enoyl-CoA hydratase
MTDEHATITGRIYTEIQGPIFLIGIDRPRKLNAFTWEMLNELSAAFTAYERHPDLRCAVLYAQGDHFTAGLDLASVAPHIAQGELRFSAETIDPWGVNGPARSKPLVCAVQGRCLTLGLELVLAADITIAAADARFSQIEVQRGIFPFGGATIRFVQVAGWGNAMRYLLTGDEFDAYEAQRLGLVQEVVSPGSQLAGAVEMAEKIARQAPLAVQATLRSCRQALWESYPEAARSLLPQIIELMKSEDALEGLKSFLERREARFKGC